MHDAVRPLTIADIAVVSVLETEARTALLEQRGGPEHLAEEPPTEWSSAIGRAWVGTLDDQVFGYLELTYEGTAARVRQVFVHPEARELGLGDALLAAALDAARAAGCTVLEGTALPGDRETKNLYERAGIKARKIVVSVPL